MPLNIILSLSAATVGFISAIFFSIGAISSTPETIVEQATTYFFVNPPLLQSLVEQRSQYLVGALLLVASFILQVASIVVSPSTQILLPKYLGRFRLVALLLVIVSALSVPLYYLALHTTSAQAEAIKQSREKNDNTGKNP